MGATSSDLGALDDTELSKLRGFTLVTKDAAGKISRKSLDNADNQKSQGNKLPCQPIVMR